jgi:hypothetical protein
MKIGDVSRPRRFADPARQRWYAYHRAVRFALRMRQVAARCHADLLISSSKVVPQGRI